MKKVIIAVAFLAVAFIVWKKIGQKEEPFKAVIFSVLPKIDGTGYALVLRSAEPTKTDEWAAAEVTENVKQWDTVIVDKANDRIIYNGNSEGRIIKNKRRK